jgi:hypothetical protein
MANDGIGIGEGEELCWRPVFLAMTFVADDLRGAGWGRKLPSLPLNL